MSDYSKEMRVLDTTIMLAKKQGDRGTVDYALSLQKAITERNNYTAEIAKRDRAIEVLMGALNEMCEDYARFIDEDCRKLLTKTESAITEAQAILNGDKE